MAELADGATDHESGRQEAAELWVNGSQLFFAPGELPADVAAFCAAQKLDMDKVIVELDGRILPPEELAGAPLRPGARMQIVHFVGGG